MLTNLKIAFIVGAIAVFGAAAPAMAQSFNSSFGTGNAASCYYGESGTLEAMVPGQSQFATGESGASAFAMVPGEPVSGSCDPALTGGGSVGYNEDLVND